TLAQFVGVLTGSSHGRHPSGSSMSPSNPGRFTIHLNRIPDSEDRIVSMLVYIALALGFLMTRYYNRKGPHRMAPQPED
ncbi:hypothetical protein AB0N06_36715, partial [Streptomyces sp. NPDC051020]|uniref:hypothetical protein n=1 Tax=Streptomyces sp. NPDC051020 TaxID=3155409 RepID=UPI00341F2A86